MHKDESSVSGTPGMQVRSIKGLLSEEVTPQSGTASTGISVRTPASTATAIMEEKKISEKESLHIRKSKEYLKMVTTDLENYLRNLRIFAKFNQKFSGFFQFFKDETHGQRVLGGAASGAVFRNTAGILHAPSMPFLS